jgi:hypothetical protein
MKAQKKQIIISVLLAVTACTSLAEVSVEIKRMYVDDNVYTPYYKVETEQDHEQGSAQRWIRIGVEYETSGGWIDELPILQSAIASEHGSPSPVILAEEVTYMNVGPGNHYSYVYMHPNCVKRYDVNAKELDSAALFSIDGKVVASEENSKDFKKGWATDPSFTVHNSHLLTESETPFCIINYDFKEIIKHQPHSNNGNAHQGHGSK